MFWGRKKVRQQGRPVHKKVICKNIVGLGPEEPGVGRGQEDSIRRTGEKRANVWLVST